MTTIRWCGSGGSGGKYGTPGAGVIIYLAPEIGPADTAGRFNGRTMLELTKTKTKHQLGDFFFHFSFLSVSRRWLAIFLPPGSPCVKEEDRIAAYSCTRPTYVLCLPLPLHPPHPFYAVRLLLPSAFAKLAPRPTRRFKPYAPFGAQVAALSQIMANKLPGEIARSPDHRDYDDERPIARRRSVPEAPKRPFFPFPLRIFAIA